MAFYSNYDKRILPALLISPAEDTRTTEECEARFLLPAEQRRELVHVEAVADRARTLTADDCIALQLAMYTPHRRAYEAVTIFDTLQEQWRREDLRRIELLAWPCALLMLSVVGTCAYWLFTL